MALEERWLASQGWEGGQFSCPKCLPRDPLLTLGPSLAPEECPEHTFPASRPAESSQEQARWRGLLLASPPQSVQHVPAAHVRPHLRPVCSGSQRPSPRSDPVPVTRGMWEPHKARGAKTVSRQSSQSRGAHELGWVPWLSPEERRTGPWRCCWPQWQPHRVPAWANSSSRIQREAREPATQFLLLHQACHHFHTHSRVCGGGGFFQTCI